MKCKYHFPVSSNIKLAASSVVCAEGFEYELDRGDGDLIVGVAVTVTLTGDEFPLVEKDSDGKFRHLDPKLPRLNEIESSLRIIEGILSVYGYIEIDFEHPTAQWHAESAAERDALHIRGLEINHSPLGAVPIAEDLLSSVIHRSAELAVLEVPLTFYRRGKRAFIGRRYIESVYEFYFFLESLFANGKTKNDHVASEFKKSAELKSAVLKALQKVRLPQGEPQVQANFESTYDARSFEAIIDHWVKLRGRLHHFTIRGPKTWHPERPLAFKADAYALIAICTEIAANRSFKMGGVAFHPKRISVMPSRASLKVQLTLRE